MSRSELGKRYLIFFFGLIFNAFGVAFITKAALGTSPIAAIPYSLSLRWTMLTMGQWMILYNVLLVAAQLGILGRQAKKGELVIQAVIALFFGSFVDVSMFFLHGFQPDFYLLKVFSLLLGCIIIAFGAYLEIVADVAMLPADAFVTAIAKKLDKEYGPIRVCSDVSMSLIAALICWFCLHSFAGVREGTVIAALITGNIVKVMAGKFTRLTHFLVPDSQVSAQPGRQHLSAIPLENFVITISREYGSGGREIGRRLAKELGFAYYDAEIITRICEESGFTKEFVEENDPKMDHDTLYRFFSWYKPALEVKYIPRVERLFQIEARVIRELASQGSCVIVGRLADYILRDHENLMNVFVSANMKAKAKRVAKREQISKVEAAHKIFRVDKERANHCRYFTGKEWGKSRNYDLALSSSRYGIKTAVTLLKEAAQTLQQKAV